MTRFIILYKDSSLVNYRLEGYFLDENMFVNVKQMCFLKSRVNVKVTDSEIKSINTALNENYKVQFIDSLKALNIYTFKFKRKKIDFNISKELLPQHDKYIGLQDLNYSSNTALVSNNKYMNPSQCNCSNYDFIYLIEGVNTFGNLLKKKGEKGYNNSEYFILNSRFTFLAHGIFSWEREKGVY